MGRDQSRPQPLSQRSESAAFFFYLQSPFYFDIIEYVRTIDSINLIK
jgi:hypothetical protein